MLVLRLLLGDLNRRDEIAHCLVKREAVQSGASFEMLDQQVVVLPVVLMGQQTSARQTHIGSTFIDGPASSAHHYETSFVVRKPVGSTGQRGTYL
jgi:hypothetical protein